MLESIVVTVVMIVGLVILTVMLFISRFLLICHPNEVIVLSGRRRQVADGATVGYRIIRGGRALRIPILEKAARMSLETIPLELSVQNAYSRGGIPLKVEAIANIKIDSSEPAFGNAVERFLNKPQGDIHEIAKDTLEGNLRGVLATLTPEEVNEDRLKFAGSLIDEADSDLKQLGLQLDTLKIQNVSDEAGYLDSIGRRKTAEVISAARKA
ncbi:flotillin family protein, partial [candidate division KSB1 bacterium]|nr:flotillin family protein [candidate division KSB1 bacterium]